MLFGIVIAVNWSMHKPSIKCSLKDEIIDYFFLFFLVLLFSHETRFLVSRTLSYRLIGSNLIYIKLWEDEVFYFSPFVSIFSFSFLEHLLSSFSFIVLCLPSSKHILLSLLEWITLFPLFSITLEVSSVSVATQLSLGDLSSCTSGYVDTNEVSFPVSICEVSGMPFLQGSLVCDTLAVIFLFVATCLLLQVKIMRNGAILSWGWVIHLTWIQFFITWTNEF